MAYINHHSTWDVPGQGSCLKSHGCPWAVQNWPTTSQVQVWGWYLSSLHYLLVAGRADPGISRLREVALPPQWLHHLEEQVLNLCLTIQWSWPLMGKHRYARPKGVKTEELAQHHICCSFWKYDPWAAQWSWLWRYGWGWASPEGMRAGEFTLLSTYGGIGWPSMISAKEFTVLLQMRKSRWAEELS